MLVPVAGVRAAADAKDDWPGVVVPAGVRDDDDRFGLGEDTALVSDSKKDDMAIYVCMLFEIGTQWVGNVPYLPQEHKMCRPWLRRKM